MEKADNMQKQMGSISREMKILEIKSTVTELKMLLMHSSEEERMEQKKYLK